ncbi:Chl4p Ecym_2542 [Eremothecium cymbalariae DBVPG|uniref:Central kinetochore subunit CHL4 n=1 Tax=Eremothecium cymbalariae (strain CBS 270.75 / DBVPG 7215 / KCTC 17166 / NRRL Y-17582) TaxID=931890 RepID=G8JQA4_ERECY|nr:Hypothetical protein Ecym_2542 [Eremothecium cymbalariae DBVPG\
MHVDDTLICGGIREEVLTKINRLDAFILKNLVREWLTKFPHVEAINVEDIIDMSLKTLANLIFTDLWPGGLNIYQLAQLDVSAICSDKLSISWVVSATMDKDDKTIVVNMDFKEFNHKLKELLGKVHTFHIYSASHPCLPLIIYRIQLFETNGSQFVSHKPFFVVMPLRYKVIFHSAQRDIHSQFILQCVSIALNQSRNVIRLRPISRPTKELLTVLDRNFGTALANSLHGAWAAYLDVDAEPTPLGSPEKHPIVVGKRRLISDDDEGIKSKKERAMLRFKGSKRGVKSKTKYLNKRFYQRIYRMCDQDVADAEIETDIYLSLVPVKKVEYIIRITGSVEFKLKLSGLDIFGGIHELCDKQHIEIDELPGWLTGENGNESGIIENGDFRKINRGGLI